MSTNNEDDKLDWMYRNANEHVDREEYLLGRRLDKNVDPQTSTASDSIPSSIFSLPESTNRVDAIRKFKEDPLEAIREKEREMRKELLKNPIQMKKIQKMLEAQKKKERESGVQKKKKVKNKKKKSKSDSDDNSDSDKELDALLSKKLAKFIKKYGKDKILLSEEGDKNKKDFKRSENKKTKRATSSSDESSDSEDSESESDDNRKQETRRNNKYPDRKPYEKKSNFNPEKRTKSFSKKSDTSSSSSDEGDDKYSKTKQNKKRKQDDKDYKDSRDSFSNKDNHARDTRESTDDRYRNSKPFGLCVPKGARKVSRESDSSKKYESSRRDSSRDGSSRDRRRDDYNSKEKEVDRRREPSSSSRNRDNPPPRWRQSNQPRDRDRDRGTHRSGLTEEEKEKKLREMMDNVSWRKDLMDKNTKRHRDQLVKEENQQKNYDENFARNQLSKGIYSESVEKRIKSNIQNIQRSAFAMDKNFAKR